MGQLHTGIREHALESVRGYDILPRVPSSVSACHHTSVESTICKMSPLENERSFGLAGFPVSAVVRVAISTTI